MPRTLSLRAVFALGGAGLAVALLLAVAFFHRATWEVAAGRSDLAAYHARLNDLAHRHAESLMERELAGDRTDATEPTTALRDALTAEDRTALSAQLAALSTASAAWRTAARDASQAPSAAAAELVRERARAVSRAVTDLRAGLAARERGASAALDATTERTFALGLAAGGVAAMLGVLFLSLVLRHTVQPLAALARHAEAELPVPDEAGLRVDEVRQLARALRQLQTQIHDRQVSLEQSRARAVSLSRFAETVQGTSRPHEIRTGVATMLEGALPDGEVQIIEWNEGQTRMQRTWPQSDGPADVAFDATTCPAIRRKRSVRAEVPSETACDCPFGAPEAGTYACVPMLSAGQVSGLVNIRTSRPSAWTRSDVVGAQAYVNFASSALGTIYVLESTRDRALRDGLTGAYNRRFLDEYLLKRLADSLRYHQPLSVLLLDLDHFKTLNDTHGHAVGDRALVEFAAMVQAQIRTGDAFVRYGGEEFVLVLSSTDTDGALVVAERIRSRAERIVLQGAEGAPPPRVTASIGVATVGQHAENMPELLAAADRAVYRAKARGRNRVEIADPLPVVEAAAPVIAAV